MELLTTFEGRISRKTFWFGLLLIVILSVVVSFAAFSIIISGGFVGRLLSLILSLVLLYPMAAITIKRLHDRDKAAMPWVAIFFVPGIIFNILSLFNIGFTTMEIVGNQIQIPGTGAYIMMLIMTAVGLWMLIELGMLRGSDGVNKYGANPLAPSSPPSVPNDPTTGQ